MLETSVLKLCMTVYQSQTKSDCEIINGHMNIEACETRKLVTFLDGDGSKVIIIAFRRAQSMFSVLRAFLNI